MEILITARGESKEELENETELLSLLGFFKRGEVLDGALEGKRFAQVVCKGIEHPPIKLSESRHYKALASIHKG